MKNKYIRGYFLVCGVIANILIMPCLAGFLMLTTTAALMPVPTGTSVPTHAAATRTPAPTSTPLPTRTAEPEPTHRTMLVLQVYAEDPNVSVYFRCNPQEVTCAIVAESAEHEGLTVKNIDALPSQTTEMCSLDTPFGPMWVYGTDLPSQLAAQAFCNGMEEGLDTSTQG